MYGNCVNRKKHAVELFDFNRIYSICRCIYEYKFEKKSAVLKKKWNICNY